MTWSLLSFSRVQSPESPPSGSQRDHCCVLFRVRRIARLLLSLCSYVFIFFSFVPRDLEKQKRKANIYIYTEVLERASCAESKGASEKASTVRIFSESIKAAEAPSASGSLAI
jgi:hypothetical protein